MTNPSLRHDYVYCSSLYRFVVEQINVILNIVKQPNKFLGLKLSVLSMKLSEVFNNFIAEQKRAQNLTTKKTVYSESAQFCVTRHNKEKTGNDQFQELYCIIIRHQNASGLNIVSFFFKYWAISAEVSNFFGTLAFKCLKIICYKLVWFWFKCDYKTYNIPLLRVWYLTTNVQVQPLDENSIVCWSQGWIW